MADNYIEKQREQYEARKAAWERAKKYGRPVTGTAQQNKPAPSATEQKKRVFVTGGAEGIGRGILRQKRNGRPTDCKRYRSSILSSRCKRQRGP